jgi:hypothetical protein
MTDTITLDFARLSAEDRRDIADIIYRIATDDDNQAIDDNCLCLWCDKLVGEGRATGQFVIGHRTHCAFLAARRVLGLPTTDTPCEEDGPCQP